MASINRTIYPQETEPKDIREWRARYDLVEGEVKLAQEHARGGKRKLAFLVLLKTFQNVGYFVELDTIPNRITSYVRDQLREHRPDEKQIASDGKLAVSKPRLYEYRTVIRQYRGVKAFDDSSRAGLTTELTQAAQTMNSTTDLINVGVEWLIKERWELPAYCTLEILALWTLADELGTGDIAIADSECYADYRTPITQRCRVRVALGSLLPSNRFANNSSGLFSTLSQCIDKKLG